ncbi:hypothetical protein Zm00014a_000219 [Zea mays]|uniref:Uncharacterized protein n=1 Tax=Zea mays TaxID=4577 RepID=A0A3L6DHU6_MAIZE|nr:hypothetical protein Zm00014a_000219 [Zea mays]
MTKVQEGNTYMRSSSSLN